MSYALNRVQLIGNLGADPEIRHMQNGGAVANLRLCTTEKWKDKHTGDLKEKSEWHRVVIFNDGLCKIVENYLHKGSKVYVEGKLQTRKWTDKDGADRYSTEVVLQNFSGDIILLDKKGDNAGGGGGNARPQQQQQRRAAGGPGAQGGPANNTPDPTEQYPDDDDIPF